MPPVATVLTRRAFLTAGGATVIYLAGCHIVPASADRVGEPRRRVVVTGPPWIAVTEDNSVLVFVDKCEMGQGAHHLVASIVGEALDLEPRAIEVEDAPVDAKKYGNGHIVPTVPGIQFKKFQMTGKSSSTADMWKKLSAAAASTRELLMEQARKKFGPDRHITFGAGHAVVGNPCDYASFAELLDAGHAKASECPPPHRRSTSRTRVDAYDKVTGVARFGIDLRAEDLGLPAPPLTALVLRPSRTGDSIEVLNAESIARMPGVRGVMRLRDERGVAVVADSFWHADRARHAMRTLEISHDGSRADSRAILQAYYEALKAASDSAEDPPADALPPAPSVWRTYVTPFGPHAAMEPLSAACVRDEAGIYHIHAATQFPEAAQAKAAALLRIREPNAEVQIHGRLAGGAFGRRAASDFILEVADICQQAWTQESGRGVKLVWTREDDFRHNHLRPCAASRVRATVKKDHTITDWQQLVISESPNVAMAHEYLSTSALGRFVNMLPIDVNWRPSRSGRLDFADPTVEEGLKDSVYAMPVHARVLSLPSVKPGVKRTVNVGYWRSVGLFHSIFAVESMVDEIAWAIGSDPIAIRLHHLQRSDQDHESMRWCVQEVAHHAGEDNLKRRKGKTGFGLACFSGWQSFAALAVEVDVDGADIRVLNAWAAVDCGRVLNPDVVLQQVEGGIIFGLSAALKQEITTVNGIIRETNFHACDSLRIHECPQIYVSLRPQARKDASPTGVGELMVPLPAPAVANAVFNLKECRLRRIPLCLGEKR